MVPSSNTFTSLPLGHKQLLAMLAGVVFPPYPHLRLLLLPSEKEIDDECHQSEHRPNLRCCVISGYFIKNTVSRPFLSLIFLFLPPLQYHYLGSELRPKYSPTANFFHDLISRNLFSWRQVPSP